MGSKKFFVLKVDDGKIYIPFKSIAWVQEHAACVKVYMVADKKPFTLDGDNMSVFLVDFKIWLYAQ